MGLLACSVLNISPNFVCVYYHRCHLFHLQPFCFFFPGHGSSVQWYLYLIFRPCHSRQASPFCSRRWSWSCRDAKHGGCQICPQQRQQWSKRYSGRHGISSLVRVRCPATSEHPVQKKARVEHIPTTWGSVWRQSDVLPRRTCFIRWTRPWLRAQQQHLGWWFRLQLQLDQHRLLQRQHRGAPQIKKAHSSPAAWSQACSSRGQHGCVWCRQRQGSSLCPISTGHRQDQFHNQVGWPLFCQWTENLCLFLELIQLVWRGSFLKVDPFYQHQL